MKKLLALAAVSFALLALAPRASANGNVVLTSFKREAFATLTTAHGHSANILEIHAETELIHPIGVVSTLGVTYTQVRGPHQWVYTSGSIPAGPFQMTGLDGATLTRQTQVCRTDRPDRCLDVDLALTWTGVGTPTMETTTIVQQFGACTIEFVTTTGVRDAELSGSALVRGREFKATELDARLRSEDRQDTFGSGCPIP